MATITNLPAADRPREKLIARGAASLSDVELLAILLGSGTRAAGVLQLAARVLELLDTHNGALTVQHLLAHRGLGRAKSALIIAALEFARRRIRPEGVRINGPASALPLLQHLTHRPQECFVCISLNGAHEVIAVRTVTVGLANFCQVHPREVFSDPLMDRACAVIIAHNHPSGALEPSAEDIKVTERLRHAAQTLGLTLLDHLIISRRGHFSFRESLPHTVGNSAGREIRSGA